MWTAISRKQGKGGKREKKGVRERRGEKMMGEYRNSSGIKNQTKWIKIK